MSEINNEVPFMGPEEKPIWDKIKEKEENPIEMSVRQQGKVVEQLIDRGFTRMASVCGGKDGEIMLSYPVYRDFIMRTISGLEEDDVRDLYKDSCKHRLQLLIDLKIGQLSFSRSEVDWYETVLELQKHWDIKVAT